MKEPKLNGPRRCVALGGDSYRGAGTIICSSERLGFVDARLLVGVKAQTARETPELSWLLTKYSKPPFPRK